MWGPLKGLWHSSTRAELAGLVMAAHTNRPLHIGIDNKAVVDKANLLKSKAEKLEEEGKVDPKKILKKHWGLQTDGDLWEAYWRALRSRGSKSIKVTKVKGHATKEQVEEGKVRIEDKIGNDKADLAATAGVDEHVQWLRELTAWLHMRQRAYIGVMADIHNMIAGTTREHQAIQKEQEKEARRRR